MSLLAACVQPNPNEYYFAPASGGGGGGSYVPAITNFTSLIGSYGASGSYPSTPPAGVVAGQTFVAPRSGAYLCEVFGGFNIGPEAVVVGTGDLITIGIARTDTVFTISATGSLVPINMPNTGSDYGLRTSFVAQFVAGGTYSLFWYATNTSTTLNLGGASGAFGLSILPLC